MNGKKIFEAIGNIDDKYIIEEKKRKKKKVGVIITSVACAAAAAVAVAVIQPWSFFANKAAAPEAPAPMPEYEELGAPLYPYNFVNDTSLSYEISKYSGLDELLGYLSDNEIHDTAQSESGSCAARGDGAENTGERTSEVIAVNGYAYHPTDDGVMITKLDGDSTENIGSIDIWANSMFYSDNRLAITGGTYEFGEDGSETPYTTVDIYMNLFEDPANPWLSDSYKIKGEYADSYLKDGMLYIITQDGQCACGYSRTQNKDDYLPYIHRIGVIDEWVTDIAFEDEDLTVLGSPSQLRYTLVTVIDMKNGDTAAAKAFYAETDKVFFTGGDIAFAVSESGKQSVFVFDGETFEFMGKIDPFAESGDEVRAYDAVSFEKEDGYYSLAGHMISKSGDTASRTVYASKADTTDGSITSYCYVTNGICSITEIIDTPYGQLISFDETETNKEDPMTVGKMLLTDYTYAADIKVSPHEFASVHGVDTAFYFGDPYGDITTFTDLGGGYYARTNEKPDAFDIIKVSDRGIELVNDTDSMLKGNERFVFKNSVIDGRLFAVSFEGKDVYLNAYSVNTQDKKPFGLIEKMPVEADPVFLETDTLCEFELFGYGGHYYYAHRMNSRVMPINIP